MSDLNATRHFKVKELVHPDFYLRFNEYQLRAMFDIELLNDLELIRVAFGEPLYINGTFGNQTFSFSGARPIDSKVGAKYSMHKYFMGFDLKAYNASAHDIFEVVDRLFKEGKIKAVTRCENPDITKTWLHIDSLYTGLNKLYVFNP